MTLRKKLALALFLAVAGFIGLDHELHNANFAHRFHELDVSQGEQFSQAVDQHLSSTTEEMEHLAQALLPLVQGTTHALRVDDPTFQQSMDMDVLIVVDSEGWVRFHQVLDPESGEPQVVRALPNERIGRGHPLSQSWSKLRESDPEILHYQGLLLTDRGPLAVGAARSLDPGGSQVGIYTGRFLTPDRLNAPGLHAFGNVRMQDARPLMAEEEGFKLLDTLLSRTEAHLAIDNGQEVESYSLKSDITGAPILLCVASSPRNLGSLWEEIKRSSTVSAVGVVLAFPFALMLLIQWIVTGPLRRLTAHSARIAENQSTTERLQMTRADEIGQLAREFDAMLDELQASRREVIETARQAGKADISIRVLHNVGNMLNHAAVGADLNRDAVRELPIRDLERIAAMLLDHKQNWVQFLTTDPRGQALPQFLQSLSRELVSRAERIERETLEVSERLGDISNLIRSLGVTSESKGLREDHSLGELIEGVLQMVGQTVAGAEQVTYVREFDAQETVHLDQAKFLEIEFQVISNAVESALLGSDDPTVILSASCREDGTLRLEVIDNGLGIDPSDLTQVFRTGYSLKPERSGLGLHLASTAAMEMGGRLWAESGGLGSGAQLHLELPKVARASSLQAVQQAA